MYIRPETMLPIAEALASKGMSLGNSCCFDNWWCWCKYSRSCIIIEIIQKKFVVSFVIILVVAISTGLIVNIVI